MPELRVYKHSGNPGNALWSVPIVGIPAVIVLAFAYGYLSRYIPCVGYVSVFLTIGYGLLIGYLIGRAAKASKCRNKAVVVLLGIVLGAFAVYCAWVVFIYTFVSGAPGVSVWDIFTSPKLLWNVITVVNAKGWYTIRRSTPSGVILWIFWAI